MVRYISARLSNFRSLLTPTFLRPGETYSFDDFKADFFAGITVAVIQVPQSMALALIAGLPAVYGLYASLPGFIASLWGSSRQLSTGPVAIVSFLTFASLVPLAEPGSSDFIHLAATLALLTGLIYLIMGLFRLDFVLQLVPHSVVVGFSSAAASIIVLSQLPTLLGLALTQRDLVADSVIDIILNLPNISLITAAVGAATLLLLFVSRRLPRTFPAAFVVLVSGAGIGYLLNFGELGVSLVKTVPESLPMFALPFLSTHTFFSLLPKAAIIALVGFVGTHASAKTAAAKTKEQLNTNQELVGQGLANVVTAFFQGFPLSGSFTRTAVNVEAGGRTPIAAVVTTVFTVITLLFFTPLFYTLPRAVLAGIVIFSALPLINIKSLRDMYHISKMDGLVAFLTFAMACILKPDDAIFIGVVAALMLFIRQTVWGIRVLEMGIDERWNILRGVREEFDEHLVSTFKDVCVVRIGAALYYANSLHICELLDEVIRAHTQREKDTLKKLVIDASGINFIDITAIEVMGEYISRLEERGIRTYTIYLRRGVKETIERAPHFPKFTILHNIAEMRHKCLLIAQPKSETA